MTGPFREGIEKLAVLVGIGFIVAGGIKLNDPVRVAELFASWRLPGGVFILFTGWAEVALGLSVVNPPTRPAGAVALSIWMIAWAGVQLAAASAAATASVVVLALMLAYLILRTEPIFPRERWLAHPLSSPPSRVAEALPRLARLVGLGFLIRWAIGGTTYWIALPLLAWADTPRDRTLPDRRSDRVLLYLLVLGIGVSGLWGFVGHTFMADTISQSVGWETSPFQHELAFYHLAIGLSGLACWWLRDQFWFAAAAIPSVFLLGAGWVHLREFVYHGNHSPANWGIAVLFGNLLLPIALLVLAAVRSRRVLTCRTKGAENGAPWQRPASTEI